MALYLHPLHLTLHLYLQPALLQPATNHSHATIPYSTTSIQEITQQTGKAEAAFYASIWIIGLCFFTNVAHSGWGILSTEGVQGCLFCVCLAPHMSRVRHKSNTKIDVYFPSHPSFIHVFLTPPYSDCRPLPCNRLYKSFLFAKPLERAIPPSPLPLGAGESTSVEDGNVGNAAAVALGFCLKCTNRWPVAGIPISSLPNILA